MCPWTPTLTPSFQQSQPPACATPLAPTTCPALQLEPSCGASQPSSGTVGGQPRSGWPERTVRGAGCSRRARPPGLPASCSVRRGWCGRIRATRTQLRSSAPQRGRRQRCRASRANVPLLLASRRARPPPSLSRPPRAPRMRLRSRRARPTTPPTSPRPPPGARARARGAAACTDAMSALPSTGA